MHPRTYPSRNIPVPITQNIPVPIRRCALLSRLSGITYRFVIQMNIVLSLRVTFVFTGNKFVFTVNIYYTRDRFWKAYVHRARTPLNIVVEMVSHSSSLLYNSCSHADHLLTTAVKYSQRLRAELIYPI